MRRWLLQAVAAVVGLYVLADASARLSGMTDFPLYRNDPQLGYIPQPNQHGRFLDRNAWAFNDRSMGVAEPFRPSPSGVLLIGDSVVLGGNPVSQPDKLGPTLQRDSGRAVWPISAGSWALQNELEEIRLNPDFERLATIVFVSNTGDFGAPSVWRSQLTHPTHHPLSSLAYLVRKYLGHVQEAVDAPWSPHAQDVWEASLKRFLAGYHGRLIWVLYPKKDEVGRSPPEFRPLIAELAGRAELVDVGHDPRWTPDLYRDGIHPNTRGYRVLARRLAEVLR